jgi:hypothetical protein
VEVAEAVAPAVSDVDLDALAGVDLDRLLGGEVEEAEVNRAAGKVELTEVR